MIKRLLCKLLLFLEAFSGCRQRHVNRGFAIKPALTDFASCLLSLVIFYDMQMLTFHHINLDEQALIFKASTKDKIVGCLKSIVRYSRHQISIGGTVVERKVQT